MPSLFAFVWVPLLVICFISVGAALSPHKHGCSATSSVVSRPGFGSCMCTQNEGKGRVGIPSLSLSSPTSNSATVFPSLLLLMSSMTMATVTIAAATAAAAAATEPSHAVAFVPLVDEGIGPTSLTLATLEGSFLGGLISGASTRITKELVLHPIDTIKARKQAQAMPGYIMNNSLSEEGSSSSSFILNEISSIKVWGTPITQLYDGISPALLGGVPAGAIFFAVKDTVSKELRSSYGINKGNSV